MSKLKNSFDEDDFERLLERLERQADDSRAYRAWLKKGPLSTHEERSREQGKENGTDKHQR